MIWLRDFLISSSVKESVQKKKKKKKAIIKITSFSFGPVSFEPLRIHEDDDCPG